jgi:nucleoid-associated protein YgaU
VKGDSLSAIAKREYGDANKWHAIYEANKDTIKDPDLIHPGQTLRLP